MSPLWIELGTFCLLVDSVKHYTTGNEPLKCVISRINGYIYPLVQKIFFFKTWQPKSCLIMAYN